MVGPAKSRRTQLTLQDWTLMKTVIDFTADELPTVGHTMDVSRGATMAREKWDSGTTRMSGQENRDYYVSQENDSVFSLPRLTLR